MSKQKKEDLRIIRTREAIKIALIELLEYQNFDTVTVKDLTTKAIINRGTFYAHFQDKYDLMSQYQDEIMMELRSIVHDNYSSVLHSVHDKNIVPQKIIVSIFSYFRKNKRILRVLFGLNGDSKFQDKMKDFIWETVFQDSSEAILNKSQFLVPTEYFISYVTSAHFGIIQKWLSNDCQESPEKMAEIITIMTIKGPMYASGLQIH